LHGFMEVAIEPTTDTPELLGPGPGPLLPPYTTASVPSPSSAPGAPRSLKQGDEITIDGYLAKGADGKSVFAGSSAPTAK